jgi:energy-coupling factor transporter ATP-binding protein EcfA2
VSQTDHLAGASIAEDATDHMSQTTRTASAAANRQPPHGGPTIRRAPRLAVNFGSPARFSGPPVVWDNRAAVNGHMLIAGPSGTGKTHQLNRMIGALASQGAARIYVVNVHGDLCADMPPDLCQTVAFHEQSPFGLPPLEVLDDPEIGGVRRRAIAFIKLLARRGALGPKQKTALYRLLEDVYRTHGFYADNARTWSLAYDPRSWANYPKRFPALKDVKNALWERLMMMKLGVATEYVDGGRAADGSQRRARLPSEAIRAFEEAVKLAGTRSRARAKLQKAMGAGATDEELAKIEGKLAEAREKSIDAIKRAMERLDDVQNSNTDAIREFILWDSADGVKSLYDRLEALERAGIFQGSPPPFDPQVPVWNYGIKSLTDDEQQLFVDTLLERLYIDAKRRGMSDAADSFIILDEAHKFVVDDGDHILNRIVKEGRKFGVGMLMASQSFIHFSDDLLTSSSLKLVMGVPEIYREQMRRKLGIDLVEGKDERGRPNGKKYNPLAFIKPQQTALASISNRGESRPMVEIALGRG